MFMIILDDVFLDVYYDTDSCHIISVFLNTPGHVLLRLPRALALEVPVPAEGGPVGVEPGNPGEPRARMSWSNPSIKT